jgi:restriction endonuclease Mrr
MSENAACGYIVGQISIRFLATAALVLCPGALFGFAVEIGAPREEVIATYGYPVSQAKAGAREFLNYKEGAVILEGGRVSELRFTKGEPRSLKGVSLPVPAPSASKVAPAHSALQQPVRRVEQVTAPVAQTKPQPKMNFGFAVWMALLPIVAATVIVAALKKSARRARPAKVVLTPPPLPLDEQVTLAVRSVRQQQATRELTQLTREALDQLEWRRFEELVHGYFDTQGWRPQRSRVGADGGIDIFLYRPGEHRPGACVQCKAWRTYTVGVKPVRELLGVMAANEIPEGFFVATGGYTAEAISFAHGKPLHLITGDDLISRFRALAEADQTRVVRHAFRDDFQTPTCPSCDEKMVRREADEPFWGCRNYPRCRRTFKMREA